MTDDTRNTLQRLMLDKAALTVLTEELARRHDPTLRRGGLMPDGPFDPADPRDWRVRIERVISIITSRP